eukprot:4965925-Amphidinium_carterae.1
MAAEKLGKTKHVTEFSLKAVRSQVGEKTFVCVSFVCFVFFREVLVWMASLLQNMALQFAEHRAASTDVLCLQTIHHRFSDDHLSKSIETSPTQTIT